MLGELLPQETWRFFLLFVRISIMITLFPNIGQIFVLPRIRFVLSFFIVLILLPVVGGELPNQPASLERLFVIIINEALIGVLIGTVARFASSVFIYAGSFFALLIGMSNAALFNPLQAQQSVLPAIFLGLLGTTALFVTDLHHMIFLALADSYRLFVQGDLPFPAGDFSKLVLDIFNKSFVLGFQIAAPFFIISVLFYALMGVLARLMPQMQVFFIALPLQLLLGFLLLAVSLTVMVRLFLEHFQQVLMPFIA